MSDQDVAGSGLRFPSQLEIAGIVAALLPFVCKFSQTSKTTVNGRVVEDTSTDYVAILAGLVAIGIAVTILVTLFPNTAENDRLKRLGAVAAIAILGAYQLLVRGAGII
jgi:uncharacterized membrane protein